MRVRTALAGIVFSGALAASAHPQDGGVPGATRPDGPPAVVPPRDFATTDGGTGAPPAAAPASTVLLASWKDGLRLATADGAFEVRIGGRLQYDADFIQEDRDIEAAPGLGDQRDGVEARRARLHAMGTLERSIEWKTEYDFAGTTGVFRDLWIGVKDVPLPGLTVRAGHMKEPFGLEENTSDLFTTFQERAASNTFAPSYNVGVLAATPFLDQRLTAALGGFRTTPDTALVTGDGEFSATGRVTACPLWADGGASVVHLGFAASLRHPPADLVSFSARPEMNMASRFVNTGNLTASRLELVGLEAALVLGPFSLQGEWMRAMVDRENASNVHFEGGYVMASLFVTGDRRPYKRAGGVFDRVRPARPAIGVESPGPGAQELSVRVSRLDLSDRTVLGGKLDDVTVAYNWYLSAAVRIGINYVYADLKSVGRTHGLLMRVQVDF